MDEHKAAEIATALMDKYDMEPMSPETMHAMATDLRDKANEEQDPRWRKYFNDFADIVQDMYTPERVHKGREKLARLKWPVSFVMTPASLDGFKIRR